MLERTSALAGTPPVELPDLRLDEAKGFHLLQVARPSKSAVSIIGKFPEQVGRASVHQSRTLMRIGPSRYWVIEEKTTGLASELQGQAIMTPLSHSRTRILLEGPRARAVLARSAPLDFHPGSFAPQDFALTGIHHMPVLIHCIGVHAFHIYALRTFALSVWEWLEDAAS